MRPSVMSNARSTAANVNGRSLPSRRTRRTWSTQRIWRASTTESSRQPPSPARSKCLIRIESRPRARGYRSNDGGGGGAVRMVVLYDDGRPGLADLRAQRGVERDEPELPAAWTRYRRRRAGQPATSPHPPPPNPRPVVNHDPG